MAAFTNKQFAAVVVLGCIGAWFVYRQSAKLAQATGEAVADSVWWYGHKLEQASDAISNATTLDAFDRKHRNNNKLMNDAQYQRWKNAVLTGQLPEPEYK